MTNWLRHNRGFILFLLCFGFFRTAIADWNPIPTGSMRPTLLEGDVVLVNRIAYDLKLPFTHLSLARLSDPRRGDVVTFTSPKDGTRLIKRIVAIPGDSVEMRRGVLFVNGEAAAYTDQYYAREEIGDHHAVQAIRATEQLAGSTRAVQFFAGADTRRTFGPLDVPADHYFMLGDNRDNSKDSRYFGLVPRDLLIGHAHHIVLSADIKGNWLPRTRRTAAPIL